MDGEVENAAEREVQGTLALADAAITEVDVIVILGREIGKEAMLQMPALRKALVKLVTEGNVQAAKLLVDILRELAADRALEAVVATRSIAEEWGVEPEWSGDRCIHCAMVIGDQGVAG